MTPQEDVEPGDEDRAFYKHPAGRKTVVLAAGSFVHFLICVLLIFGTILAFGTVKQDAPVLAEPIPCVPLVVEQGKPTASSVKDSSGRCADGAVPGIAAAAGLRSGDRVIAVGSEPIEGYVEFQKLIRASAGKPLEVLVENDGARRTLRMTPVSATRPAIEDPKRSERVGAIGVQPQATLERVGLVAATKETGQTLELLVIGTYESLTKKLGTITSVYSEDRDPAGFVGVVGVSRVSGEIFEIEEPFTVRLVSFLFIVAGLNLFVGIFNLLPLLPLDGGHIAVVWFEAARDRIRRARGYVGEIQRVDYNRLMPVTLAVIVLFAGFTLWLLGADIVNPIRLSQ